MLVSDLKVAMADNNSATQPTEARVTDAWRDHGAALLSQARRMLRDERAAEDAVQEAFRRLQAVGVVDEIEDLGGWLSVVVRRLCLNQLRSAYARREVVADDLGDDWAGAIDPADRVTLDDEVQHALALVLQRLSPAERTAFLLHDVFGFPFDAVAEIVGRTPSACRKLASRARRSIRHEPLATSAVQVEPTMHQQVVERFIAACAGGDLKALMDVLDQDVDGHAELVGFGPIVDITGRPAVAQRLVGMFGPGTGTSLVPVSVEGDAAVVAYTHGRLAALVRVDVEGETVRRLRAFVLPPRPS